MLAAAITLLFTLSGLLAVLAIADAALKARRVYGALMREAALMQAGFVVQVDPQELRVRRTPAKPKPARRASGLMLAPALAPQRLPAVPAFAAA